MNNSSFALSNSRNMIQETIMAIVTKCCWRLVHVSWLFKMDRENQTTDFNKTEIVALAGVGSQAGVGTQAGVGSQTGVGTQAGFGSQTNVNSQTDSDKRPHSRKNSESNNEGFSKRKIYPRLSKKIYPRISGLAHSNPRCTDRQISRQRTLDGESWDTCAWLEHLQIFKMLERRSSHADPELSCIVTYWRRRFR